MIMPGECCSLGGAGISASAGGLVDGKADSAQQEGEGRPKCIGIFMCKFFLS